MGMGMWGAEQGRKMHPQKWGHPWHPWYFGIKSLHAQGTATQIPRRWMPLSDRWRRVNFCQPLRASAEFRRGFRQDLQDKMKAVWTILCFVIGSKDRPRIIIRSIFFPNPQVLEKCSLMVAMSGDERCAGYRTTGAVQGKSPGMFPSWDEGFTSSLWYTWKWAKMMDLSLSLGHIWPLSPPQQPKRKADSLLWTGWKPPRDAWKIMGTQWCKKIEN
jgi:hypothetical protein